MAKQKTTLELSKAPVTKVSSVTVADSFSEPRCGDCKFYVESHEITEDSPKPHHGTKPAVGKYGHCRQKPPSIVHGIGPQVTFPMVSEDCWCGEFKPK